MGFENSPFGVPALPLSCDTQTPPEPETTAAQIHIGAQRSSKYKWAVVGIDSLK